MIETRVTPVGMIMYKNKILIMKRNSIKKFSPNKWEYPSGFMKEKETVEECILREIKEETGLEVKIIKKGITIELEDGYGFWIVPTYLCESDSDKVKMSEEHVEYKWITPNEIVNFDTIKSARKDLEAVGLL